MGAIAAIRVIYFTVGAEALRGTWVQTVCIVLTLVTIFMGSFMGCTENGLKKRLAYSSISQISYVLLGVFLMTPVGLLGGLLQLLFHALAKIGVFQSAGSIIFLTGTETIDGFPGLGRRIPVTMAASPPWLCPWWASPPSAASSANGIWRWEPWTACPPPCAISFRRCC